MVAEPFAGIDDGRALAKAIVDTLREPLLVLDSELRVVAASRSFYLTFQVARQDVQGRPVYALGDGQWDIPELRLLLEEILPHQTIMDAYLVEQDFDQIGRRTMLLNARAVFNQGHANTLILLAIEDITDRRAVEREMAELLQQKEVLLLEMQHRVANSLQIIASILLLKARTVQSEETRQHLQDAHRRVLSVAAVQQQLYGSGHGEPIELAPYLSRLCETLAASMIGESRPIDLIVQAAGGTASTNEAVSFGLIVTELVINALKHAFVGDKSSGTIIVSYDEAGTNWRLAVSDNGIGKSKDEPAKTVPGLGTSIVEALAKQFEARVEISMTPHGTSVSIVHGASVPSPVLSGVGWQSSPASATGDYGQIRKSARMIIKKNKAAYVRVALQELINPQIQRLIEESLVAEGAAIAAIDTKENDFLEIQWIALRAADVIAGKIAERGFPNEVLEQRTA